MNLEAYGQQDSVQEQEQEQVSTQEQVRTVRTKEISTEDMNQYFEQVSEMLPDCRVKIVTFSFKKTKDKSTGVTVIREPVTLPVPYPSMDGIFSGEDEVKEQEFLRDAVESVVNTAVRELLSKDFELNVESFDSEKVLWKTLANAPKLKRGGGIPKEVWEAFSNDYITVMPEASGRSVTAVTNAAKLFMNKFSTVKTRIPVLELLVSQLAIYAEASPQYETYASCVGFLLTRADEYMNMTDEDYIDNL